MTKQARLYLKNGLLDWIDPVVSIAIDNGYNIYMFTSDELENLIKIEIIELKDKVGE
jgi:hypothetical protein